MSAMATNTPFKTKTKQSSTPPFMKGNGFIQKEVKSKGGGYAWNVKTNTIDSVHNMPAAYTSLV